MLKFVEQLLLLLLEVEGVQLLLQHAQLHFRGLEEALVPPGLVALDFLHLGLDLRLLGRVALLVVLLTLVLVRVELDEGLAEFLLVSVQVRLLLVDRAEVAVVLVAPDDLVFDEFEQQQLVLEWERLE